MRKAPKSGGATNRMFLFGGPDSMETRRVAREFLKQVKSEGLGVYLKHEISESVLGNEVISIVIRSPSFEGVEKILRELVHR